MRTLLLLAVVGCTTTNPGITGTQSLEVDLVSPDPGTIDNRLDGSLPTRMITVNVIAKDAQGNVDTTFNNEVQVYLQYLSTLSPYFNDGTPAATWQMVDGQAMSQTLTLPPVFGPTTIWVDDGGDTDPTYATGTSPTLWYRDPFIYDIQFPGNEMAIDALDVAPLDGKNVEVGTTTSQQLGAVYGSRYGATGRLVVTSVFSQGYTVADTNCQDTMGTPPCVSADYDYMEVFSYSRAVDQTVDPATMQGRFIVEGQMIDGFAGGVSEFDGLTEIGFPQTFVFSDIQNADGSVIIDTTREPTPNIVDATWFQAPTNGDVPGIIFERNEAAIIEVDNAYVCPLDSDYTTYFQWKIDIGGGANCGTDNVINIISAGVIQTDPSTYVGTTLTKVYGALRPVNIGSFNVWIIYPRSQNDIVQ